MSEEMNAALFICYGAEFMIQ